MRGSTLLLVREYTIFAGEYTTYPWIVFPNFGSRAYVPGLLYLLRSTLPLACCLRGHTRLFLLDGTLFLRINWWRLLLARLS